MNSSDPFSFLHAVGDVSLWFFCCYEQDGSAQMKSCQIWLGNQAYG